MRAAGISKDGDKFGTGVPDAIIAPEVANNACVPAAVVPLLSFGIPGSTSAAIMLGAMVMHGMRPARCSHRTIRRRSARCSWASCWPAPAC